VVALRSCGQRTHCSGDAPADALFMNERAGQYDSMDTSADSRPSERIITTLQVDMGGPLSPASRGPHTNEMEELVTLRPEAARLRVFEDEDDFSTQLLFRMVGNIEPENEARWLAAVGNDPVTVINAWPSWEMALGAIRRDTGEKSKTVTFWGNVMLKTGWLSP
jgi:hypothetical protein